MSDVKVSAAIRRAVRARAAHCCEYCRTQEMFSSDPFSLEHIVPRGRGGSDEMENLAYSCLGCNLIKGTETTAIDPLTREQIPIFHPRLDKWAEHFRWNDDFTQVEGVTASGRATVERLRLNRIGLVNLRRELCNNGKHPPA